MGSYLLNLNLWSGGQKVCVLTRLPQVIVRCSQCWEPVTAEVFERGRNFFFCGQTLHLHCKATHSG